VQQRGVARAEPGLGFVGLHFMYAMSPSMIHGAGRDAEDVASRLAPQGAGGLSA
jgi:hypothetical protein